MKERANPTENAEALKDRLRQDSGPIPAPDGRMSTPAEESSGPRADRSSGSTAER